MHKMPRIVLPTVALSAVLLVGVGVVQASHSWGGYHWARTANPFTLQMGDNVSTGWDSYLAETSEAWSISSVLDTTVVEGKGGKSCKAQTGRIEVCSRTYGYNGWLGLAQIYVSGTHITKGIAKMNDSYFNLSLYNTPDERLHVMCQEVGHLFGLGHTSEDGTSQGTCMDYSTSPDSTLPNAHDYEQLEAIYAHLDTFTTVGSTVNRNRGASALAKSDDFENAAEWGKEIYRSTDGHASVFERDLGHGERLLTHVRWAE